MPPKKKQDEPTIEPVIESSPAPVAPAPEPVVEPIAEPVAPLVCPYMSHAGSPQHGLSIESTFASALCIGEKCAIYAKCQKA